MRYLSLHPKRMFALYDRASISSTDAAIFAEFHIPERVEAEEHIAELARRLNEALIGKYGVTFSAEAGALYVRGPDAMVEAVPMLLEGRGLVFWSSKVTAKSDAETLGGCLNLYEVIDAASVLMPREFRQAVLGDSLHPDLSSILTETQGKLESAMSHLSQAEVAAPAP